MEDNLLVRRAEGKLIISLESRGEADEGNFSSVIVARISGGNPSLQVCALGYRLHRGRELDILVEVLQDAEISAVTICTGDDFTRTLTIWRRNDEPRQQ
jgi:hypothetical protein